MLSSAIYSVTHQACPLSSGQCTCSTAAGASCGSPFCSCHWTSQPHHAYTHLIALVTSPSTNHLQTVHHDAFSVLWWGSIVYIWHCYSSHTSTRPCPPMFGEKRRLQLSTCTLWIWSAFILGVWTWYLEQSASSAERHRCCLHLQASLKVWTLPSSLRRFDDYFNRCWTLRQIALLIVVFIDDMCVSSFLTLFLVSL